MKRKLTSETNTIIVTLCWSHGKQYDLVYTKEHLEALTVSQAIVYDVLYKDVFELGGKEVDFAVTKMLYDKEHFKNKRHLTFSQWCNSVAEGEERNVSKLPEKNGEQIVLAVRCGVPPFPFKVAKCLDPNLFRNVDYLNWCEEKRDEFRTGHLVTPALDTGVKCTARIGMKEHTGFVQSIDTKGNTAQVFLQSIGEIRTLPLSSIESLPVSLRVTLASHHALRNNAVEDDEHCRTYRVAVSSGKSQARNRRSFSTGDAVTADQLEVLLRKQQHSVHKRAHGGTSKDSSENSPSKLGGIPEAAHDRDSLGSHSVSTQEGSRSQGGQNMKMSEHDDVMSTHEDAENVARHTRGRPRKFSLPAVKTNYGPPSSPVASCYTPTIMNACGPVLVNGHPGTYGAIDAVSGLAGISESGVTVVPQLSARPAQTIIFDPNYSYATADIQRVPDSTIYATAPGTTAHGGCGFQHPPMGIGEYPIVPMNPVPVVPIAQFNPSVPPPNYRTIPALHSLVAPASAATTDWTLDYPMESVEPGFSFRAPPQEMNMSLIDMSHFLDGSDLPLHRLDIVRYFFNLGLSVYRSRKLPEGTPADSLPAPVACTQAAPTGTYIVPLTSSAGYQMVPPQGTVVYQQAPPASYPTTAGPTYASYSVLPQAASYTEISPSTITTAGPTSYAASVPAAAPVQAQMTAVK
ncbi:uncharacterized protein LOC111242974 isoform X2 [Varroa destructor]|uniref:Uncharacterized protein n=1 Tax=Varroa destructor TaxID=109461 RepID=A0A7M7J6C0_VARDE|nr:uncharacterized protein LOC111242974 isoform X2 [Varroa destructor]